MNRIRTIAIAACLAIAGVTGAWAQEVVDVVTTEVSIVDQLIDSLGKVVLAVVGICIAWASTWVRARVMEQLKGAAQDTVLMALDRAVALATAAGSTGIWEGVSYLKRQVPDAIRKLKMDEKQLDNLIRAEIVRREGASS